MNKLQQEHLDAIDKYDETGEYDSGVDTINAAKSCASITIEHMKGFADFIKTRLNYNDTTDKFHVDVGNGKSGKYNNRTTNRIIF